MFDDVIKRDGFLRRSGKLRVKERTRQAVQTARARCGARVRVGFDAGDDKRLLLGFTQKLAGRSTDFEQAYSADETLQVAQSF